LLHPFTQCRLRFFYLPPSFLPLGSLSLLIKHSSYRTDFSPLHTFLWFCLPCGYPLFATSLRRASLPADMPLWDLFSICSDPPSRTPAFSFFYQGCRLSLLSGVPLPSFPSLDMHNFHSVCSFSEFFHRVSEPGCYLHSCLPFLKPHVVSHPTNSFFYSNHREGPLGSVSKCLSFFFFLPPSTFTVFRDNFPPRSSIIRTVKVLFVPLLSFFLPFQKTFPR